MDLEQQLRELIESQKKSSELSLNLKFQLLDIIGEVRERLDTIERFIALDPFPETLTPIEETVPCPTATRKPKESKELKESKQLKRPVKPKEPVATEKILSDGQVALETGFGSRQVALLRNKYKGKECDFVPTKFCMFATLSMLGFRIVGSGWVKDYCPLIPEPNYKSWADFPDIELEYTAPMTANSLPDDKVADRLAMDDKQMIKDVRQAKLIWYLTPKGENELIDSIADMGFFPNPLNGRWYCHRK